MPLFHQKNQSIRKLKSFSASKEKDIKKLVESNLGVIFDMYFLATEYSIAVGRRIDTFAVDKNGFPVIIEYKKRNDENVISQSISYLKWLQSQKQEFFEKMVETKVKNLPQDFKIRWGEPRVICIAESFNKYDLDTVEMITQIKIELYRYMFFEDDLFQLEQMNVEEKTDAVKPKKSADQIEATSVEKLMSKCSEATKELFRELQTRIFTLDSNIEEKATTLYVAYRLTKNFVEVHFNKNEMKIYLRSVDYNDPNNMIEIIPEGYNWTLNRRIYLRSSAELDYVTGLIMHSYNDVL